MTGVDVIEETGQVVAHLNLGYGGQVAANTDAPGLVTWSHQPGTDSTDEKTVITYTARQWR